MRKFHRNQKVWNIYWDAYGTVDSVHHGITEEGEPWVSYFIINGNKAAWFSPCEIQSIEEHNEAYT